LTHIHTLAILPIMRRISVYISEPQYGDFQALAANQGRPYSELIREALSQYLRRQHGGPARRRPRSLGAGQHEARPVGNARQKKGRLR